MDPLAQFHHYLQSKGLKITQQRFRILEAFLEAGAHPSTEELYLRIRQKHPGIGYATVYRTLKLLADCGIAAQRHFGDGFARYEAMDGEEHHDHLICTACGAIQEFEDPAIEQLQQRIAGDRGFTLTAHRLDLYGLCPACRAKKTSA